MSLSASVGIAAASCGQYQQRVITVGTAWDWNGILSLHHLLRALHASHMLSARAFKPPRIQCRRAYASASRLQPVKVLRDAELSTFRQQAFEPQVPVLLPRQSFLGLPAIHKWFTNGSSGGGTELNVGYLGQHGGTSVPLEISDEERFERVEQPLRLFLECVSFQSTM